MTLLNLNRPAVPAQVILAGVFLSVLSGSISAQSVPNGAGAGDKATQKVAVQSLAKVPQSTPYTGPLARAAEITEPMAPVQPPQVAPAPIKPVVESVDSSLQLGVLSSPATVTSPLLTASFQGIAYTGWIPPDTNIATGPGYVVVATNESFATYSKTGLLRFSTTFSNWFAQLSPPSSIYDPKIAYESNAGRWILLAIASDASTNSSYYLISVSQNADPTGVWALWKLDAGVNGSTASGLLADNPSLGYDSAEAVYIGSNQYSFAGVFQYAKIRILYKSQLYWVNNPTSLSWWDFWQLQDAHGTNSFAVRPARAASSLSGNYLSDSRTSNGTAITLWRLANPLSQPPSLARQATVAIGSYSQSPPALQLGSALTIESTDCRLQDVVYQNGQLITSFAEGFNWASGSVSAIRALEVDATSNSVNLNSRFGADLLWYFYPQIISDAAGNLAVVFSRSGASEFAGCRYSVKLTTDTQWEGSNGIHNGLSFYYSADSSNRNRWGDYNGAALDPADGSMWLASQYAQTTSQWNTWVGQIASFGPAPSATPTPTPTPTPVASPTPTPTATPRVSPTPTPTPSAVPSPTPTPELTATPTPTPISSATPTLTPTPTPTPTTTPSNGSAVMISPVPGSTFSSSTVTFLWTSGSATFYDMKVGSAPGQSDIIDTGFVTALTRTVPNIPTDGRIIYVRLYSLVNGSFLFNDYTYRAFNPSASPTPTPTPTPTAVASPTSTPTATPRVSPTPTPTPTVVEPSATPTVSPTATPTPTPTPTPIGGVTPTPTPTPTVTPANGSAVMISPVPGSTFGSSTVTFQWTAGSATFYDLRVGSALGQADIIDSGFITTLTRTVTTIPTDGRIIYVRLYSLVNGAFLFNDYTYRAFNPSASPTPTPTPTPTAV